MQLSPADRGASTPGALFLPLAFRFAVTFGLTALQLALPSEPRPAWGGETVYLLGLVGFFLEGLWECSRSLDRTGSPFSVPSLPWIRVNLLLDLLLVAFIIAFHGVGQERFATIYIFPVLASAFYLRIPEIIGVGALSVGFHVASVLLFIYGGLPPFGNSGPSIVEDAGDRTFLLAFATLQILGATLVVVLIRKHLETLRSTLSESEATVDALATLYRRVFDSMFSGLVTVDLEGRITSANPAAEAILQRPLPRGTHLEELGLVDLTHHGVLPREQRFEHSIQTTGGASRIVGGNVAPLKGSEGQQTGHLVLFQDLTELKVLEERTRLSERLAAVGELSSELAHELRNPLASILGCVEILRQQGAQRGTTDRALAILHRESERVSALLSDFLDFTRPRAVKVEPLWLPTLASEARDAFETDPRSQGINLALDPGPSVWVLGDPICAHQVLGNLLSNARKAVRDTPEPKVGVTFRSEPGHVVLSLSDNGRGMDAEQLRTAFLPFVCGFPEGTGLGLSLVFQFVQRMGWDIQLDSDLGRGTTARLRLPLAPGS